MPTFSIVADDASFPTASRDEAALIARLIGLMGESDRRPQARSYGHRLQHRLDPGAAGTARTIRGAVHRHRAGHQAGLRASVSKRVSVLGTEATVAREYTRALIRDFAQGADITLVGSSALARFAEAELHGAPVSDAAIAPNSPPAFATTARAPTRWCSPAPITHCCSTASNNLRPGRCSSSIRPRRSRGGSRSCSTGPPPRPRATQRASCSPGRRAALARASAAALPASGSARPRRTAVADGGLTARRFRLKTRHFAGPIGPARCFATRGLGRRFGAKPVGSGRGSEQRRARSSAMWRDPELRQFRSTTALRLQRTARTR